MKDELLKILIEHHVEHTLSSEYIKLKCIFHDEKTGSLFLYFLTDTFFCFGCSKFGTISEFISKITGVSLREVKKKYQQIRTDMPEVQDFSRQINLHMSKKIYDVFQKIGPKKELLLFMSFLDESLHNKVVQLQESYLFVKNMEEMLYNISGKVKTND